MAAIEASVLVSKMVGIRKCLLSLMPVHLTFIITLGSAVQMKVNLDLAS